MAKFVNSERIIAGENPINLDEVITFEKFTDEMVFKEEDGKHQIVFLRNDASVGPKKLFWKYKSECDRDADLQSLIDNNSQTLN